MSYVLIRNSAVAAYPYGLAQLRADNPQVSFPAAMPDDRLAEFGVLPVAPVPQPAPSDPITKDVVRGTPVLIAGVWTQVWTEANASAGEIARRQDAATQETQRTAIKADAFVSTFIAMTPAEVTAYIDANVTNLASAKTVISKLALMSLLLARREFR